MLAVRGSAKEATAGDASQSTAPSRARDIQMLGATVSHHHTYIFSLGTERVDSGLISLDNRPWNGDWRVNVK